MAKRIFSFLMLFISFLMTGCFNKETTDTELYLKVLIQEESGSQNTQCEGIKAYAYAVYDTDWEVVSFEDALNGVITSSDQEKRSDPDVTAEEYVDEITDVRYLKMYMSYPLMMIVTVDTEHQIYAYTFKPFTAINLSQTYLTLILHLWKKEPYTEGNEKNGLWNIVPPKIATQPTTTL